MIRRRFHAIHFSPAMLAQAAAVAHPIGFGVHNFVLKSPMALKIIPIFEEVVSITYSQLCKIQMPYVGVEGPLDIIK